MSRHAHPLLCLALAGCPGRSPVMPPEPPPAAPAAAASAPAFVVVVEQLELSDAPHAYDPTGRYVADETCGLWIADTGEYAGQADAAVCEAWLDLRRPIAAPTGAATVALDASGQPVVAVGDDRIVLRCADCGPVLALAWAPDGASIAVLREGASRVEIWDVRGTKRHALALEREDELVAGSLAWPGPLHVLAVRTDGRTPCDEVEEHTDDTDCLDAYTASEFEDGPPSLYRLYTFAALDEPPQRTELEPGTSDNPAMYGNYDAIVHASLDPLGRCLYYEEVDADPRESIGSRVSAIELAGPCPLEWTAENEDRAWRREIAFWTDDPSPRYVEVHRGDPDTTESSLAWVEYEIEVAELSLPPRQWEVSIESLPDDIPGSQIADRGLTAIGSHGAETVVVWEDCFEDGERSWCTTNAGAPAGCSIFDVSPDLAWFLADCGKGSTMLPRKGKRRIDIEKTETWAWGRTWLATIGKTTRVRRLDRLEKPVVSESTGRWVPATLGHTLDRIVFAHGDELRILDPREGTTAARVPNTGLGAVVHVAFDPEGRRLAVTDGQGIAIADLEDGVVVHGFAAPGTRYLAWREDGQILFGGPDDAWPTSAWTPEGGERPRALPVAAEGEPRPVLDPSWRWGMTSPHRVTRLLDGASMWFDEDGAMLDNGLHDGEPDVFERIVFRTGDDPTTWTLADPADVPQLRRPGLVAAFLAGKPLERGPIRASLDKPGDSQPSDPSSTRSSSRKRSPP